MLDKYALVKPNKLPVTLDVQSWASANLSNLSSNFGHVCQF